MKEKILVLALIGIFIGASVSAESVTNIQNEINNEFENKKSENTIADLASNTGLPDLTFSYIGQERHENNGYNILYTVKNIGTASVDLPSKLKVIYIDFYQIPDFIEDKLIEMVGGIKFFPVYGCDLIDEWDGNLDVNEEVKGVLIFSGKYGFSARTGIRLELDRKYEITEEDEGNNIIEYKVEGKAKSRISNIMSQTMLGKILDKIDCTLPLLKLIWAANR